MRNIKIDFFITSEMTIYIYYVGGETFPTVEPSFNPAKDMEYLNKIAPEFVAKDDSWLKKWEEFLSEKLNGDHKVSIMKWNPVKKCFSDLLETTEQKFHGSWQNRWGSFLWKIHAIFPESGLDLVVERIQSGKADIWECIALRETIKNWASYSIYDKEVERLFTEHLLT